MVQKKVKEEKKENYLSVKYFTDLLNKINLLSNHSFFTEKEKYIYQILTLHTYTDFLITNIIREKFEEFKNTLGDSEKFIVKLEIIYASKILSKAGFEALNKLNKLRNNLVHKFEIKTNVVKDMIDSLKDSEIIGNKKIFERLSSPIEKLEVACIHYINALRIQLMIKKGMEPDLLPIHYISYVGDKIHILFTEDKIKIEMFEQNLKIKKYIEKKYGKKENK